MSVKSRALSAEVLTVEDLSRHLGTQVVGRRILVYPEVASTNTIALELGERGEPEGTVVVAETQTAGRGRSGRPWFSSPHLGLWTSVLFRPPVGPGEASLLSQLAAVSLAEAIAEVEPSVVVRVKWPNDLVIGERKVAGILVEVKTEGERVHHAVVGIGVNINHTLADFPEALHRTAVSLFVASGKPVSRLRVAQALYRHLEAWYLRFIEGGSEPVLARLSSLSGTVGRWVRVETGQEDFEAFAEGINRDGSLRVRLPSGEMRDLVSGEVTIRQG
ncbi:MAG: biotin--[acetyl-CoA-carboxylase] ligase [candidate division NC10 bacterium]|nr:biotin--[acetyl-CoA-carboxylase] ligase [candidate division NC10 bacterium]